MGDFGAPENINHITDDKALEIIWQLRNVDNDDMSRSEMI